MAGPASPVTPVPAAAVPGRVPGDGTQPEPTHGCVRCGARIPLHESMCEACNPLGLKSPSASQAHGTVFLGIGLAVVIMAVVARALIADIGPFRSSVAHVAADPAGLRVTVSLTNAGSAAGTTTCRIDDPSSGGISPAALFIESPRVGGGETITFDVVVPGLGSEPREMLAVCGS
jgi:predicted nucleic acid-binding Zn ribbon protein